MPSLPLPLAWYFLPILKVATPQIILNFASFLEENAYHEEAFRAYEKVRPFPPFPPSLPSSLPPSILLMFSLSLCLPLSPPLSLSLSLFLPAYLWFTYFPTLPPSLPPSLSPGRLHLRLAACQAPVDPIPGQVRRTVCPPPPLPPSFPRFLPCSF